MRRALPLASVGPKAAYRFLDLGAGALPHHINDAGEVVGEIDRSSAAFAYVAGKMYLRVQVSGGMAGLIVVQGALDRVPEIAAARDIHIAVQSLQVNPDATTPNLYTLEYQAYQTPQNGGYNPRSDYMFVMTNGQLINLIDFTTVNFGVSTAYAPPQLQAAGSRSSYARRKLPARTRCARSPLPEPTFIRGPNSTSCSSWSAARPSR